MVIRVSFKTLRLTPSLLLPLFPLFEPWNANSALFDAIHLAIAALRNTSLASRQVILLISGEHDHGSSKSDIASLIRDVSASNSSIYSLTFRPGGKELPRRSSSLDPLAMTASSFARNAAEELAALSGGGFYRFDSDRSFEDDVISVANHIHNRYSLTFQPSGSRPGFHTLQVEVRHAKANVVSARNGYWRSSAMGSGSGGEPQ
jgi:hypothetical protein